MIADRTPCPTCGNECSVRQWRRVPDGESIYRLDLHYDHRTERTITCKSYRARVLKAADGTWRFSPVT